MNKPWLWLLFPFSLAAVAAAPAQAGSIPATLEIYEIQGNGPVSPHAGSSVTVPDSIVTAVLPDGFFLQTPDGRADPESSLTSNGLRVVTAGAPVYSGGGAVAVGHRASVTGEVVEHASTETRLVAAGITRVGSGTVALPDAAEFSSAAGKPRRSADNLYCYNNVSNFECFEGMRVVLPEGVAAAGTMSGGDVYVAPLGERSLREKGVRFGNTLQAGNVLAGIWDGNPEVLRMDPDRLGAAGGSEALVGGARFQATGVVSVEDGNYELWPSSISIDAQSNQLPDPLAPRAYPDSFRVASFDLGALCDATADAQPCASPTPSPAQVSARVARLAEYIAEVLGDPDVVAVQNVENSAVLGLLATAVSARVPGSSYSGHLIEGSAAGGLDLGFLVNSSRISNAGVSVAINDPALHPKAPLLLEADYDNDSFMVLNVHIDTRQGVDSGAPGVRQRRFDQAHSIATRVQALQVAEGPSGRPLLVAGKFHGATETDGYVDVVGMVEGTYFDPENLIDVDLNPVSPLLRNVVELHPQQERITAMTIEHFGAVQNVSDRAVAAGWALDHILLTEPARRVATFTGIGRGNADATAAAAASGTGAVGSAPFDGVAVDIYPDCASNPATNSDNDSWCNLLDNCPLIDNEDQTDTDGDFQGDLCDADDDGDGIPDDEDNCPLDYNPGQEDADEDGIGDLCDSDQDGDGVPDDQDNCPTVPNPGAGQGEDYDNDGEGDACDPNTDMVLQFSATPSPVQPGQELSITASVVHAGPHTVQQAELDIALSNVFAVQSVDSGAWTCDPIAPGTTAAVLSCSLASFPPGSASVTVSGTVSAFLKDGQAVSNAGVVTPYDVDPANNAVEFSVPVVVLATDLGMDASGPSDPAEVGDDLAYVATVTNLGARAADDVVVSVQRPFGTQFFDVVAAAGWTCTPESPALEELECSSASLPIGGSATLQFKLLVGSGANGTMLHVSPTVSASTQDPNPANNVDTISTPVGIVTETIFANGFEG